MQILARYVHPSAHLRDKYPNFEAQKATQTSSGCKVLRQARKTISRKEHLAVVVSHPDFPGIELYAVKRWFKVTTQGPADYFFNNRNENENTAQAQEAEEEAEEGPENLAGRIHRQDIDAADLDLLAAAEAGNFDVDDDNLPAPENQPNARPDQDTEAVYSEEWGHDGIDNSPVGRRRARWINHPPHLLLSRFQIFEVLYPI